MFQFHILHIIYFFLKQYKKLHNLVVGDLIRVSTLEKEKKTNKTKSFIGVCILKKRYSLGIKIVLKKIIKIVTNRMVIIDRIIKRSTTYMNDKRCVNMFTYTKYYYS